MTEGNKPKTTIILPNITKPNPKNLRNDFKNSHKQNKYTAPKNVIRKAGPRGG